MKRRNLMMLAGLIVVGAIAIIAVLLTHTTCCSEQISSKEVNELIEHADKGDTSAMQRLRFFYEESGDGTKANHWLQQGALHGDPLAEFHLADELLKSKDQTQVEIGMKYLKSSAEHGEALAQKLVGERYRDGNLVKQDLGLAQYWLKKAAEQQSSSAILSLVDLLASQAKSRSDYVECLEWNAKGITSPEVKPDGATYLDLVHQREQLQNKAKASGFDLHGLSIPLK